MAWEKREFDGFLQFRETPGGRWRFQIYGFQGEPGTLGTCSVYAVDGKRECLIDAKNRLNINGKWYSPRSWDH